MTSSEIEQVLVTQIASRLPSVITIAKAVFDHASTEQYPWSVHGVPMNDSLVNLYDEEYWAAAYMLALIVDLMLQDEGVY